MLFTLTLAEEKLLEVLGLKPENFYRLRKVFQRGDTIIVSTQGGGPNRVCYCECLGETDEEGEPVVLSVELNGKKHEADCSVVLDSNLRKNKFYVKDADDPTDPNYALWVFKNP